MLVVKLGANLCWPHMFDKVMISAIIGFKVRDGDLESTVPYCLHTSVFWTGSFAAISSIGTESR
jgi:hypothetical protein